MKAKVILIVFSFFILFNIVVWSFVYIHAHRKLTVAFLDVGQGDAIYIQAPNGNQMLIDGGPDKKVVSELGNIMPFGDKNIDAVLATHPDADHIGGFPYVFDSYKIGSFINNGAPSDTQTSKTLQKKVTEEKSFQVKASRGMEIILDEKDNVVLSVLAPYQDTKYLKDTNEGSIVLELSCGSSTFMFTGDAPQDVENYLVEHDGIFLKNDVLKVGHHGSRTSSSETFVKTVAPEFAIISDGKNNRYGHPHKEVLDLLNKFGINILRTDQEGTVVCESDAIKVGCK